MSFLRTIGRGIRTIGRGVAKAGVVTLELIHGIGQAVKAGAMIRGIASLFD